MESDCDVLAPERLPYDVGRSPFGRPERRGGLSEESMSGTPGFVCLPGSIPRLGGRMNFHGVVMNVADLDRSIDFYRQVLGFALLSREDQLAVVGASGSDRSQAIVLRAFGSSPLVGAGHIGLRSFIVE